jgi:hypothetical protein
LFESRDQIAERHRLPFNARGSAESDSDAFRRQAYAYVLAIEQHTQQQVVVESVDDVLFCRLGALRHGCSKDSLIDVQNIVRRLSEKAVNGCSGGNKVKGQLVRNMFLCLNFEGGLSALLRWKLWPVECIHVAMTLKAVGVWSNPQLELLIAEFVRLLPAASMWSAVVDYLAFGGDTDLLVEFLLTLGVGKV